ncbi:hydrolase [Streptomyces inusitatus]|uniref:Hydrolase n=1 Tax=Streptomyces inusitatus TaxID=68221 RepID=A0A918QGV0_9ACTN|nr:HAD-IA family hydrolase [Streptomyces inusitatus]GGZ44779.1 hydrolase [Streptomyces inusitatus]
MGLSDAVRRHVLLDFDGPVCSLFAGAPAPDIARDLHDYLTKDGIEAPESWGTDDPLALLRAVADTHPALVEPADTRLTQLETSAAGSAAPTPGGREFLDACAATARPVWIVSNNSGAAIRTYLAAHGLTVAGVFGRVPGDPTSMKPSARLLADAMAAAESGPSECVFIGDAVRDVEAGKAAGVGTIGYANKPHKDQKLRAAGAVAVTTSMTDLAQAVLDAGEWSHLWAQ